MGPKFKLCAVLALALTIGVFSLVATAGGAKKHGKKVEIINLTLRTAQEADLDLGPTGPSLGDRFVFSEDAYRGSRQVGIDGGECTVTRLTPNPVPPGQEPTSVEVNCVVTLELPNGQLTAQGLVTFSEEAGDSFTIAVTGGTGSYRTAHGEATVTPSEDEDGPDQLRIKLIR